MRQTAGKAVMDEFKAWRDAEPGAACPKGPMREAINYVSVGGKPSCSS